MMETLKQPSESVDVYVMIRHQVYGDKETLDWVATEIVKSGEWVYVVDPEPATQSAEKESEAQQEPTIE